jgi:hypothetical protein
MTAHVRAAVRPVRLAVGVNGAAAEALADRFWSALPGGPPPPPRDVVSAATLAAELVFVDIPGLRFADAVGWMAALGVRVPGRYGSGAGGAAGPYRLNGCLIAHRGHGAVFLDAGLPPDRRRWTAAHEVGHWLAEYDRPRRRARERLGEAVLAVLDGLRPATDEELMAGVLAGVTPGVHVHCLRGDADDPGRKREVRRAEAAADALARELLAPASAVAAAAEATGVGPGDVTDWADLLVRRFGLPPGPADAYAARLARSASAGRGFSESLGL